jgi:hypothetical protein
MLQPADALLAGYLTAGSLDRPCGMHYLAEWPVNTVLHHTVAERHVRYCTARELVTAAASAQQLHALTDALLLFQCNNFAAVGTHWKHWTKCSR